jgi:hypothetical protein
MSVLDILSADERLVHGLAIPEEYGGNPVSTPCSVLVTVVAELLLHFGTEVAAQLVARGGLDG